MATRKGRQRELLTSPPASGSNQVELFLEESRGQHLSQPIRDRKIVHFQHPAGYGRTVKVGACVPDRADHGHGRYSATQWQPDELPAFVDLRPHLTAVEDQGEVGSCTANALAGALEYLEKRMNGAEGRVSRLFIYWNERDAEGSTSKDQGAALSDGIKVLKGDGACSEDTWQYSKDNVFEQPADEAYQEGKEHTIDEAHQVQIELHDMRHCLSEGYPFVFGLEVYDAFQEEGNHGHISTPQPGTHQHCGGHAMLAVGYSDKDEVFLVRNSWGPNWGDHGYCYIPYDYLASTKYCRDAWTIRKAHNLDFTQGAGGGELPHGDKDSFFDDNDDHTVSVQGSDDGSADQADDTSVTSDEVDDGQSDAGSTGTDDDAGPDDGSADDDQAEVSPGEAGDDSSDDSAGGVEQLESELEAELGELGRELQQIKAKIGQAKAASPKKRK